MASKHQNRYIFVNIPKNWIPYEEFAEICRKHSIQSANDYRERYSDIAEEEGVSLPYDPSRVYKSEWSKPDKKGKTGWRAIFVEKEEIPNDFSALVCAFGIRYPRNFNKNNASRVFHLLGPSFEELLSMPN